MCICLDSSKDWRGSQGIAYQVKVPAAQQAATEFSLWDPHDGRREPSSHTVLSAQRTVAHEHSCDIKQTLKNQHSGQKQQNLNSGFHGGWQQMSGRARYRLGLYEKLVTEAAVAVCGQPETDQEWVSTVKCQAGSSAPRNEHPWVMGPEIRTS